MCRCSTRKNKRRKLLLLWLSLMMMMAVVTAAVSVESDVDDGDAYDGDEHRDAAFVVCGVDGTVYTLDAWTGSLRGLFASGPALVSSSTFGDAESGGADSSSSSSFEERIVPGLDGSIYSLRSGGDGFDVRLDLLPVDVADVTEKPVSTCEIDGDGENSDGNCGIVMGERRTKIFALDVSTGKVNWMQHPSSGEMGFTMREGGGLGFTETDGEENDGVNEEDFTSSDDGGRVKKGTVLLQREDFFVRNIDSESGQESWNLTVARFAALDFSSSEDDDNDDDDDDQTGPSNASTTTSDGNVVIRSDFRPPLPRRRTTPATVTANAAAMPKKSFRDWARLSPSPSFLGLDDEDGFDAFNRIPFTRNELVQQNVEDEDEAKDGSSNDQWPLPSIAFGEDGTNIMAVDSLTGKLLWKRNMDSMVAAVYGVGKENRWSQLDVIDEEFVKIDQSPAWAHHQYQSGELISSLNAATSANELFSETTAMAVISRQSLSYSPAQIPSNSMIISDLNRKSYALVPYTAKNLPENPTVDYSERVTTQLARLSRQSSTIFVSSTSQHGMSPLRSSMHGNFIGWGVSKLTASPKIPKFVDSATEQKILNIKSDEDDEMKNPIIQFHGHRMQHGFFVTWRMICCIICLVTGVVAGMRFHFIKQKQEWESLSQSKIIPLDDTMEKEWRSNGGSEHLRLNTEGELPGHRTSIALTGLPRQAPHRIRSLPQHLDSLCSNSRSRSSSLENNASRSSSRENNISPRYDGHHEILDPHYRIHEHGVDSADEDDDGPSIDISGDHRFPRVEFSAVPSLRETRVSSTTTTMTDSAVVNGKYHSNGTITVNGGQHANGTTLNEGIGPADTKESFSGVSSINGIPLVRYSRYESEFTERSPLGKGGFGAVFKCVNAMDSREYAIKKIRFKSFVDTSGEPTKHLSTKLHRVLREVKILALLDHPNIVRYYTAWLESDTAETGPDLYDEDGLETSGVRDSGTMMSSEVLQYNGGLNSNSNFTGKKRIYKKKTQQSENPMRLGKFDSYDSEEESDDSGDFQHKENTMHHMSTDLGFDWDRSTCANGSDVSEEIQEESTKNTTDTVTNHNDTGKSSTAQSLLSGGTRTTQNRATRFTTDSSTTPKTSRKRPSKHKMDRTQVKVQKYVLYIQMQLCGQKTLFDILASPESRKAASCPCSIDDKAYSSTAIPYVLRLYSQIASAVKHVHQRGLIHRDLKPSNCFIDETGVVKVGDFGLSRTAASDSTDAIDISNEIVKRHSFTDESNTAGIGTRSYASPEQMNGSDYDASTDVYSLGIMLFEMCYPTYTAMEKLSVFEDLRKRTFPSNWNTSIKKVFPELHKLLFNMLSPTPSERPSSSEVAKYVDSLLGEYTVQSLDPSEKREGSFLLRVEAIDKAGSILRRTLKIIKGASPHVTVVQYGLRGQEGSRAIMEFDISLPSNIDEMLESDNQSEITKIINALKADIDIVVVREVRERYTSVGDTERSQDD